MVVPLSPTPPPARVVSPAVSPSFNASAIKGSITNKTFFWNHIRNTRFQFYFFFFCERSEMASYMCFCMQNVAFRDFYEPDTNIYSIFFPLRKNYDPLRINYGPLCIKYGPLRKNTVLFV